MPLEGNQKIAALLLTLDRNVASQVLRHFKEEEILAIGEAMKEISGKDIPKEEMDKLYDEFREMMRERFGVFRPRDEALEELLKVSLGPEKSASILDMLNRRYSPASPFKALAKYPKEILARVFRDEHPQTIALALSSIESNRAAQVITELDEAMRLDILTRIARLKHPPNDVCISIAEKLRQKADRAMAEESPDEVRIRLRTVADVLNRVDKETEKSVLGQISETDADMAEEIKELMFTFDDLLLVDKRAMQKILSGINVQVLALALKAANKEVENFILSNVSQRVRKLIEEEKDLMGPKTKEEVNGAQKEIVATVRALIESGEITINRASEEELLV